MKNPRRLLIVIVAAISTIVLVASPALAHEAPDGSEWVMADWMFLSFATFAAVALILFFAARRRGLLSNLEDAKYPMMEIDEPDYYTPDWAREETEEVQQ